MTSAPLFMAGTGSSVSAIGGVVSLHMAGMYVFAPAVALLATRFGAQRVLLCAMVALSLTLASTALVDSLILMAGRLFLVGVCWSAIQLVTTLTFATTEKGQDPRAIRVQGTLDLVASFCAGSGIALAGVIYSLGDYSTIQAIYGLVPVSWLILVAVARIRRAKGIK
jgi:MFS family permease